MLYSFVVIGGFIIAVSVITSSSLRVIRFDIILSTFDNKNNYNDYSKQEEEEDRPFEIVEYINTDACSAYLPKKTKQRRKTTKTNPSRTVAIKIVSLGKAYSFQECISLTTSFLRNQNSDKNDDTSTKQRCKSACWFHHYEEQTENKTIENQCYGLLDPIWMPRQIPASDDRNSIKKKIDSARIIWPCIDDSDCSYNGQCSHKRTIDDRDETGRCECYQGWRGYVCDELDLLPVDENRIGYRKVDLRTGQNISSWGAPILFDNVSQKWHGYVSEIHGFCGINAWETNSQIVHITSNSPYGPYKRQEVVWPIFSHEPSVVRGPQGEWVMLFSSYHWQNETDLDRVYCNQCQNGVTPKNSKQCPYQMGKPRDLSHTFRQMMSIATSPDGPWSDPIEIPQLSQSWDWNTALTINMDGSAVALIRGGMTWYATNYSNPETWNPVGSLHGKGSEGPGWIGVSVEDPYIWPANGIYHALAHAFNPFFGVHAYAPIPSSPNFNWTRHMLNWTVTGVAYDNIVQYHDGRMYQFSRRERPHLIWSSSYQEKDESSRRGWKDESSLSSCLE